MKFNYFLVVILAIGLSSFSLAQQKNYRIDFLKVKQGIDYHQIYSTKSSFDSKKPGSDFKSFSYWFDSDDIYSYLKEMAYDSLNWTKMDSVSDTTNFVSIYVNEIEICTERERRNVGYPTAFRITYDLLITNVNNDTLLFNENGESTEYLSFKPKTTGEFKLSRTGKHEVLTAMSVHFLEDIVKKTLTSSVEKKPKISLTAYNSEEDTLQLTNNSLAISSGNFLLSGTHITNGYILTDRRLFINPKLKRYVHVSATDSMDIELVAMNKKHNIALARIVTDKKIIAPEIQTNNTIHLLDEIHTYGTTGELYYYNTYFKGHISAKLLFKDKHYFLTDSPSHISFTGAGVYNQHNELLGVSILSNYDSRSNIIIPCLQTKDISQILNFNF